MTESFIFAAPFLLAVIAAWDYTRRCAALERDRFNASADLARGNVAELQRTVSELSLKCEACVSEVDDHSERFDLVRDELDATKKRLGDIEKNQTELGRRLDMSPKLSKFARG